MAGQTDFDAAFPGYFLCVFPLWFFLEVTAGCFLCCLAWPPSVSVYLSVCINPFIPLSLCAVPCVIWIDIITKRKILFLNKRNIGRSSVMLLFWCIMRKNDNLHKKTWSETNVNKSNYSSYLLLDVLISFISQGWSLYFLSKGTSQWDTKTSCDQTKNTFCFSHNGGLGEVKSEQLHVNKLTQSKTLTFVFFWRFHIT